MGQLMHLYQPIHIPIKFIFLIFNHWTHSNLNTRKDTLKQTPNPQAPKNKTTQTSTKW